MLRHEEIPEQAVTFKEHRRQRELAGCPIAETKHVKAAPPISNPKMPAQERAGEAQRQMVVENCHEDEPAATSNAENDSAVSSEGTMSESSAEDAGLQCEICTAEGAYA